MVQLRNSSNRYGVVTKTLHWSTAGLVAFQFATGLTGNVEDEIHAPIGVLVLLLVVVRMVWRATTPLPDWAPTLRPAERRLAHWTERLLYLGLLAKPITGLLLLGAEGDEVEIVGIGEFGPWWEESKRWEEFFEGAHAWAGYVLLGAIAIHVGMVLKHQLVDRDRMLQRMLPFTHQ